VAQTEPLFSVGKKVHLSGILMLLPVGDRKNGTAVEQRTLTSAVDAQDFLLN
jgi:hypothetical protein